MKRKGATVNDKPSLQQKIDEVIYAAVCELHKHATNGGTATERLEAIKIALSLRGDETFHGSAAETHNELESELIALAIEKCLDERQRDKVMREIEAPNFVSFIERENWKYLIPQTLADAWNTLPHIAKLAVYIVAKEGIACGPCID